MSVYLVYVQIKNPTFERFKNFATDFVPLMQRMSEKSETAFRSTAFDNIGYFLKTNKAPAQIRSAINDLPTFLNGDTVMVVELGQKFDALGNSAAWTWLQHNL